MNLFICTYINVLLYCLLFDTRFCGLFFLWCHILTGRGIVRFVLEGFLFENFFKLR